MEGPPVTERVTNEILAKDLYILTGQVHSYGAQMDELRDLLTNGFRDLKAELTKLDNKLDDKVEKLEHRVRGTETHQANHKGANSVLMWVAVTATGMVSTVVTWFMSHFAFK